MDIFREIDVRNTQAIETIKNCFEKLRRKNIPTEYVSRFGQYLVSSGVITKSTYKRLNIEQSKSSKSTLLKLIRDHLDKQDYRTCDILLAWMDHNNFYADLKEVEKQDRQYALEHMKTNEKKVLSSSECRERLEMFVRTERFLQGHETYEANCMYQALYRAIDKPGFIASPTELKQKLTADFLAKHKPANYVVNVENLMPDPNQNWIGFVAHLQQRDTPGHPFVLYAASMRYNFIIHIISVITLEEYVLYPDQRPKTETQYQHVYLAHMQQRHYVSLIKIKDSAPLTYEELSVKVQKYEQYLPALRTQFDDVSDMKFDLERNLNEKEDKIVALENHVKSLETENKKLKWKFEEKEEELEEKNKRIQFLESELRQKRLESRSQKAESRAQSHNYVHDTPIPEENTILKKLEEITTSQRVMEEQTSKLSEQNERLLKQEAKIAMQETKIGEHDVKLQKILDILQDEKGISRPNSNGSGAEAASVHSIHSVNSVTSNTSRKSQKSRQGTVPSIVTKRKDTPLVTSSNVPIIVTKRKDTPVVQQQSSNLSKGSVKSGTKTYRLTSADNPVKDMEIPALTMSVSNLSDILEPRIDPSPPPDGAEKKPEPEEDKNVLDEERIRNARSVTDLVE